MFSTDPFFTSNDPFGMTDFGKGKDTGKIEDSNGLSMLSSNISVGNGNGVNYNNISNIFNSALIENNMTAQNNLTNNMQGSPQPQQIETALNFLDKKIEEMKVGFSRGILNDDFPLDSLDPLKSSSA